jgi:hypothetical protein
MKKLIVSLFLAGIVSGVSAQSGHVVASNGIKRVYIVRPQIAAGVYSPFYGSFGYYGYPFIYAPFGYYPYYPYGMGYSRPTELQKKQEDIRADYQDRIFSVRQDSSLSSSEKRQTIRSLKKQCKQDIKDLVANYHRRPFNENSPSEKSQSVE